TSAAAALNARSAAPTMARSARRIPLLRRFAVAPRPAIGRGIVASLGLDPIRAIGTLDLFPKWGARLQVIHQEFRGGERRLAMRGRGDDQDDVLAWPDAAIAMDHSGAEKRPALSRLGHMPFDLGLGHPGIVLERERGDRRPGLVSTADAGEGDDGADIAATFAQPCALGRGVERFPLQADRGDHDANLLAHASDRE